MKNKATGPVHTPRPQVRITIGVYNDEKHVANAIESALGQTLKDVEVIVVDDGSTDGTIEPLDPHDELLKTSPTYQNLWKAQQRPEGGNTVSGQRDTL